MDDPEIETNETMLQKECLVSHCFLLTLYFVSKEAKNPFTLFRLCLLLSVTGQCYGSEVTSFLSDLGINEEKSF